ncbi:MAG: arginine repressor [Firmicutes bacterium]|nr:arginine repressor [Bacillota bacterium]
MHVNEAILRHVAAQAIGDQRLLLELLRGEGHDLTLSTLSRRMKKLGIRKDEGVYRRVGQGASSLPAASRAVSLRKVQPCLLIIRTPAGAAQALAVAMDEAKLPSLAGSVSGYDTIFAAAVEPSRLDALEAEVRRHLGSES